MKLQGIGIIFVMIAFPMILILSYYVQLQIDTITLQTSYDNKLIDATYDSIAAFEINTANEDLSSVSDSLRTIINASTTTFTNTLGTSLGLSNASKERIQEYIPAILYTLYDGYYIYAPTEMPVVKEDLATEDEIKNNYGIENSDGIEISEGAQYAEDGSVIFEKDGDVNGTTNSQDAEKEQAYVLKSYMPYSATYEDGANYVTINYTLDNFISVSGTINGVYYTKSGYYIKDNLVTSCNIPYENMGQDELKKFCEDTSNSINITIDGVNISTTNDANRKAITYYLTNTIFSKWVNEKLGFVTGANLKNHINDTSNADLYYVFSSTDTNRVFFNATDPENDDSSEFINHKYNIIKNAIQYNLNLAISTYNEKYVNSTEFRMPQLTDNQWEQITGKVSIVSFMQGLPCGTKTYNGYAVVSSTNNELTVIPEEIYYIKSSEYNNESSRYHRIDCPELSISGEELDSFKSKEVKYDKIYDKTNAEYLYDHRNLGCYNCIVQSNYDNINIYTDPDTNRKRAYYIAIGKERQNLYKTTAYSKNEGIRIDNTSTSINWENTPLSRPILKAEITIKVETTGGVVEEITINSNLTGKRISTATKSIQTVVVENNDINGNISCTGSADIDVLSIKYIYK